MELIKVTDNIFLIKMKNQYQLTSTFMRLQEFYESPYESIRGNYFTVEEYMDTYAEDTGNFTYNTDWNGFNVPGDVVNKFFSLFENGMKGRHYLRKEYDLGMLLQNAGVTELEKFYVIGVHEDKLDTMRHEMAHAFYYTDEKFHKKMIQQLNKLSLNTYHDIRCKLIAMGYCEEVIADEIQAYLSTSNYWDLIKDFGVVNAIRINISAFRQVFKEQAGE